MLGKERTILEAIWKIECTGRVLSRVDEPGIGHDLPRDVAQSAARKLVAKGLIIRRGIGRYRLTAAGKRALAVPGLTTDPARKAGRDRPRMGERMPLPYEKAWKAMRITRHFTQAQIMTAIDSDAQPVNPRNIRGYFAGLVSAGYLRITFRPKREQRTGGSSARRYAIVQDTGPLAPAVRLVKGVVHDPNIGRDIPLDGTGPAMLSAEVMA